MLNSNLIISKIGDTLIIKFPLDFSTGSEDNKGTSTKGMSYPVRKFVQAPHSRVWSAEIRFSSWFQAPNWK